jgi:glycosyltransferase involved in cell wall biosynthesis
MRILMLANAASPHTRRWAGSLAARGHTVAVVSIRAASIEGVEVTRVGWGRRGVIPSLVSYLVLLVRVRPVARRFGPDVVNAHYSVTHGAIAVLARLRPVVVTVWGSDLVAGDAIVPGPKRWWNRFVLRRVTAATAASEFLLRAASEVGAKRVHLIPFGVDTTLFSPRPRPDGPFRVGFVKHLHARYGPDVLIDSFARFTAGHPGSRLVMAGSGPMLQGLQRRAAAAGIGDAVEFPGAVAHGAVPDLLAGCDVLVNPSRSESFGVILLEAAAMGLPVIATRVGGTTETVLDGVTGFLVEPGDPEAIARRLTELADDAGMRAMLGAAGRERVVARFEWSQCVDAMEGALAEAVGS